MDFQDIMREMAANVALLVAAETTARRGTPTALSAALSSGASQELAAAKADRKYFSFQNPSANANAMWVNLRGATAVKDHTAVEVQPGQGFTMDASSFVTVTAIHVIGTSGQSFYAVEA